MYLIPSEKIAAKGSISVGNKYTEFEVKDKNFGEFANAE